MPFTDKDGHLINTFQKEKHDTASQLLKKYANRNWSGRWLNLFRKNDKSRFCSVVDVAQLDHAVIVQFNGVARLRYPTCVKAALHIVNTDFDLI